MSKRDEEAETLSTAPRKLVTTEPDVFVDLVVVVGVNVDFDGDGKVDVAAHASTLGTSNCSS